MTAMDRLLGAGATSPARTAVPAAPAASGPSEGVGFGLLLAAMGLSALVGAGGGYYLSQRSLSEALAKVTPIRVVDVPTLAMQGALAGDPEAGVREARRIVEKLVEDGYVVVPRGAVLDAPGAVQVPAR